MNHKRSTLAEANEKRPALIFQKTYEKLLKRFQAETIRRPQESSWWIKGDAEARASR